LRLILRLHAISTQKFPVSFFYTSLSAPHSLPACLPLFILCCLQTFLYFTTR